MTEGALTSTHWTVVREVISSTTRAADLMSAIPGLVRRLLDEDAWRSFTAPGNGLVHHETFKSFLEAGSPCGLGGRRDQLMALCGADDDLKKRVSGLLDIAIPEQVATRGAPTTESRNSRVTRIATESDTREYIIAKLKRDRPDLAERVIACEISADAAAKIVGYRKPRIVVTSPESVARSLRRHMPPADLARLAILLAEDADA